MADEKLPTRDALIKHINDVKTATLKHAGNPTFNPHLWVNKNVRNLETEVLTNRITSEVASKVLALKAGEPPK